MSASEIRTRPFSKLLLYFESRIKGTRDELEAIIKSGNTLIADSAPEAARLRVPSSCSDWTRTASRPNANLDAMTRRSSQIRQVLRTYPGADAKPYL